MSDTLTFTVPGEPVAKARARVVRGRTYTPERTRLAEEAIGWEAIRHHANQMVCFDAHYGLKVTAYCKDARKDADNLLKTVMDGLAGVVYLDDRQVFDARCIKVPVKDNPRTEVFIWRME